MLKLIKKPMERNDLTAMVINLSLEIIYLLRTDPILQIQWSKLRT